MQGVQITVNSDDPAYFPGYVADNLVVLQGEADLTREDIVAIVRNAFVIAWLDDSDRSTCLDRLDSWVTANG